MTRAPSRQTWTLDNWPFLKMVLGTMIGCVGVLVLAFGGSVFEATYAVPGLIEDVAELKADLKTLTEKVQTSSDADQKHLEFKEEIKENRGRIRALEAK